MIAAAVAATIRPVPVATILAAHDLLLEHWAEVARNRDLMQLYPRVDVYDDMERAGVLLCLGAYDGDTLVGYSATIVQEHLHYAGLTYAVNDVLFVRATHRAGSLGLRLIRTTESESALRGARLMLWHAKQGSVLDTLLARKSYAVQDVIYSREL